MYLNSLPFVAAAWRCSLAAVRNSRCGGESLNHSSIEYKSKRLSGSLPIVEVARSHRQSMLIQCTSTSLPAHIQLPHAAHMHHDFLPTRALHSRQISLLSVATLSLFLSLHQTRKRHRTSCDIAPIFISRNSPQTASNRPSNERVPLSLFEYVGCSDGICLFPSW